MRRRILAFTLVLAMLLGLGPAYAAGAGAEEPAGEILSFTPLEQTEYTVPTGTPAEELGLPGTVAATVRETVVQLTYTGAEEADMPSPGAFDQPTPEVTYDTRELETVLSMTWESQPAYDPDTAGVYTFTARAVGYALAEGAAWPAVTVTVEPAEEPAEEPVEEPAVEPTVEPTEEPTEEPAEEPTEEPVEEPAEEPAQAAPNSALDGGVSLLADGYPIRYRNEDSTDWRSSNDLLGAINNLSGDSYGYVELLADVLAPNYTIFSKGKSFGLRSNSEGTETYTFTRRYLGGYLFDFNSNSYVTLANIVVDGGAKWGGTNDGTLGRGTTNDGETAERHLVHITGNSSLTLDSGAVLRNNDTSSGHGGVYVGGATFNMTGGSIINVNGGGTGRGGVYVDQNATFNMSDGSITGNSAGTNGGGGVGVNRAAKFNMDGGSITGNTARGSGGGVSVLLLGTINLSGAASITGNTVGGAANNLYLASGSTFTLRGPFTGTVGITQQGGSQVGGVIGTVTGIADGQVVSGITCDTDPSLMAMVSSGQLVWTSAVARYSDASGTSWTYTNALSDAIANVSDGGVVELLQDVTQTTGISVGDKAFTLRSYSGGEDTYAITRGAGYTGSLLTVSGTGDVTLADIVLDGNQEAVTAAAPLLTIGGGTVTMNSGSTLRNNRASSGAEAAGVYMTGGTFTLEEGAEISGNVLQVGGFQAGGIQVGGGTAYLRGRIIGNEGYDGGGVLVDGANANVTITGQVTNNRASAGGGVYVAEGSATLDGATVTGNAATSYNTGGAFLYNSRENASGSSLTLTGQVTITGNTYQGQPSNLQIYTSKDQPRTVTLSSGLSMDSDIGVRILTNTGLFATGEGVSFSDYVDVFTPDDGSYIVQAKTDGLYLTDSVARMSANGGSSWTYYDSLDAAINAVNGGTAETNIVELLDDVTADARVVQGKSLTLRSSTEEGAETYTITRAESFVSTMFIAEADCTLIFEDIVVDGGDIDATSGTMIWANGGSVVLGEGAVVRNCVRSNNDSGAVEVNTTGTLTMRTGAVIENSRSDANGGAVKVAGTFNMEGGSITGGQAAVSGGGVAVDSGGVFNMTGGSITGSSAAVSGGGVYVATGGAVSLSGAASISGNTAGSAASNLYLASGSTLTLTSALTGAENSIGVTQEGGSQPGGTIGTAGGIADSDDVTQIFSDVNSELVAVVESGALKWQEEATGVARYSDASGTSWTYTATLGEAIANVPANGYVELLQDVTLTEGLTVSDKSFTLRSNSDGEVVYTIERGGDYTGSLLTVSGTGNVTLADIVLDGGAEWGGEPDATLNRGTTNNGLTAQAALVQLDAGALTLNSGAVLQNNDNRNTAAGSIGGAVDTESAPGGTGNGTLTMNAGASILNNYGAGGGGVYLAGSGSSFTMNGGLISGNEGVFAGGSNTTRTLYAGGVMLTSDAIFTMEGGEIRGNRAMGGTWSAGGVTEHSASIPRLAGTVSGNTGGRCGGVLLYRGSATISGQVTGNTATGGYAGGINVTANAQLTLEGATITGNTGGQGGVVGAYNGSTVNLTGAVVITGNTDSSGAGRNLVLDVGMTLTMTGDLTDGVSVGVYHSRATAGRTFGAASSADLQGADKFFCDTDPTLYGALSGTDLIWGQYVAQLVGGAGDGSYYTTLAAAVGAYGSDTQYIAMVADSTGGTVTVNQNLYLDLAGHTVADSITVGDGFTLYGFDSTTNGYDSTGGYGMLTGLVSGTVANVTDTTADQTGDAMRYLKVTEDGGVSFHRFDMRPKSVVFRPSAAGIYFTGLFYGDQQVKNAIQTSGDLTFGLYFGLIDDAGPTATTASAHDPSTFTTGDGGDTRQGAMVTGIVTKGGENNATNTERAIYVSAYFNFADAGITTPDTMQTITLTQVIQLAAAKYSTLDDTQKKAFDDFWVKFKDLYPDIQHTPETDDEETP